MPDTKDDPQFNAASNRFLEWLSHQQGTDLSSKIRLVDLRTHGQGRGVVATDNIEAGDELFTLSYETTLTVQSSAFYVKAPEILNTIPYWAALVLVLIYEYGQGHHSRWEPYLQLLPDSFNTLMYWSDAELSELRGCNVLHKIGKDDAEDLFETQLWPIARAHRADFAIYTDLLSDVAGKASFKNLCHRMASLIFAYGFDHDPDFESDIEQEVSDEGQETTKIMLVPLADMLNADADLNNAHLVQNQTTVTMIAVRSIRAGDQIYNDFGGLPRSDLLRRYGYITERYKTYDVVELSLDLIIEVLKQTAGNGDDMQSTRVEEQIQMADQRAILDDGYDLGVLGDVPELSVLPSDLVQLLLLLQDDMEAVKQVQRMGEEEIHLRNLNQISNLIPFFKTILHKRFEQYPTTLAQDQAILADGALAERKRMAIEVRLGEKEILAGWLEAVNVVNNKQMPQVSEVAKQSKRKRI